MSAIRCKGLRETVSYQKMSNASDGLSFEKALAELEKIVERMESGELSLEQALATHKRGLELARFYQQRLEAAQQQVKVLEGEVLKPLELRTRSDEGTESENGE